MRHTCREEIPQQRPGVASRRAALALAGVLLLAGTVPNAPCRAAGPDQQQEAALVEVRIEGLQFVPKRIAVRPQQMIRWINRDLVPHTVLAADGSFSSPVMKPGDGFVAPAPPKELSYRCTLHTGMEGTIAPSE